MPYKQSIIDSKIIREFAADINEQELVWHRDRNTRSVRVLQGINWQLQLENQMPQLLETNKTYVIPAMTFHRLLLGQDQLVVEIQDL